MNNFRGMYAVPVYTKTQISINNSSQGEHLETKLERKMVNKEPIENESDLIYTEKADGVLPGFNIRTDRWEIAAEGTDAIQKSLAAKRDAKATMKIVEDDDNDDSPNDGKIDDKANA